MGVLGPFARPAEMRRSDESLRDCLDRARRVELAVPCLIDLDGKGLRPPTARELSVLRAGVLERALEYARWRYGAYLSGECAHRY